ncbi:helix-hairpin-helix domain-containing protein [Paenibacillus sp. XY044]|uniref:helix-hairpin-helix domain-containing protein n=1 Tax=Paenibacillus sp. XY044 TaxID=2026089 RepID=UPI00211B41AA|nr:helix-hairpin-helix domain-containing protein [Paenibacillus sp. XY044]
MPDSKVMNEVMQLKQTPPKLPLTPEERAHLRAFKVKLKDICTLNAAQLSDMLEITHERANMLRGLAMFQSVPSIGPKVAARVVDMGYYSLDEIKDIDGADFIDRMEAHFGYWEDPCLEDALRCLVHHANHPGSERIWPDFTEERKKYREQYGYPASRPVPAWYEHREGEASKLK